jgi:hypothetical protein
MWGRVISSFLIFYDNANQIYIYIYIYLFIYLFIYLLGDSTKTAHVPRDNKQYKDKTKQIKKWQI